MTKIIVGLGNPGLKYAKTRHNAGWLVLDQLIDQLNLTSSEKINWQTKKTWSAKVVEYQNTLLVKPQTMMNCSGQAIQLILNYYHLNNPDLTNNLLVIHDELDLPLGITRWSTNCRSAGHNGVQSIINQLGTQNFNRYRIGIQSPQPISDVTNYVLKRFSANELKTLKTVDLTIIEKFINN